MDPTAHLGGATDHLPDENYNIERLFPKCPPKPQTNQSSNSSLDNKRPRGKNGQRKASRSRVQQHSRRELQARRNQNSSSAATNNNSNNNNMNANSHLRNSSESSDDNTGGGLRRGKRGLLHLTGQPQSQKKTSPGERAALPATRRAGKYVASQSLLQQLQRSQSSYSASNSANNNTHNPSNTGETQYLAEERGAAAPAASQQPAVSSGRVVKSASSFAFSEPLGHLETPPPPPSPTCPPALGLKGPLASNLNGQVNSRFGNNEPLAADDEQAVSSQLCTKSLRSARKETVSGSAAGADAASSAALAETADTLVKSDVIISREPTSSLINDSTSTLLFEAEDKRSSSSLDEPTPRRSTVERQSQTFCKDDDKYINLFVYDNATNQLQKSQILTNSNSAANLKSPQDKEPQQQQTLLPQSISPPTDQVLTPDKSPRPTVRFRQEYKAIPNIISVHHQASEQLLSSDTSDTADNHNVVRNDASVEELCSGLTDDLVEEDKLKPCLINNAKRCIQSEPDENSPPAKFVVEPSEPIIGRTSLLRSSSNRSLLQTVDEQAEIAVEEISESSTLLQQQQTFDKNEQQGSDSDTMPANLSRKGLVTPGYPQRITPTKVNRPSRVEEDPDETEREEPPKSAPLNDKNSRSNDFLDKTADSDPAVQGLIAKINNRNENHQRLKPIEENHPIGSSHNLVAQSDKLCQGNGSSSIIRRGAEQSAQMPVICEAQNETELDYSPRNEILPEIQADRDLSSAMNKVSLAHAGSFTHQDVPPCDTPVYRNETSSAQSFQPSVEKVSLCHPSVGSNSNSAQHTGQLVQEELPTALTNLRHHKLPNETSHYSIVRASNNSNSNITSRSSNIQFNVLSEGESGADESPTKQQQTPQSTASPLTRSIVKKSDLNQVTTSNHRMGGSSLKNDDDMLPSTTTALIFPRLDEGLSSDAESMEEEVEEEDERAMDADVDADDDDDEEEDIEDEVETDTLATLDRGLHPLQIASQSSVEGFMRQQQHQQQLKPQSRVAVLQQQSNLAAVTGADQAELGQVKSSATYGNYGLTQEPLEHNDLSNNSKPLTNYPNQNGQSNYWIGVSSHQQQQLQQQALSAQPSSSQHFNQRGLNSGAYSNRDEAKASNRLSSDTDNETDRLLGSQRNEQQQQQQQQQQLKLATSNEIVNSNSSNELQPLSNVIKPSANSREVLIEGILFNVKYLGSTHSDCEGRSEKEDRIHQAETAVHEVKFRNGESQSATEVQLFISTEKIMVLDDKHRKIMMDHSLRTISYIADIGDAIVLIVRRKSGNSVDLAAQKDGLGLGARVTSKISCHVFESIESHTITKSISQAFQVAYTELLKANGTGGGGEASGYLPRELDYQEVLNSQEMSTDELEMFARKENQREVIVPKEKGEILGLSIVESGWGSVLPTVVIANLKPDGPAYRCKRLSIGDQILSVNGISLVGLPLAECQDILRRTKNQRVARLSVVPCPITVEVKIKRPDTKYQLGFSVQNGVICSLLRGGIAERGGVRVGHRIMSINGTTVVGVPHEKIVTLLASSVGEIRMKTCLTSLYRLILGEENPVHF